MTPEEHQQELQRLERELRQKETELRLRELESKINQEDVNFYQTTKIKDKETGAKLWQSRAIIGLKLFGLLVVGIALVRVASFLASALIVSTLVFVGYKLFLEKRNKK
ncbi:MAG: hypothetical protein IGS39_03855 [Calothrix sp. C42_A2020_038]|nr:hypothetical protein [Calothrix sp. C42_A2020_038]